MLRSRGLFDKVRNTIEPVEVADAEKGLFGCFSSYCSRGYIKCQGYLEYMTRHRFHDLGRVYDVRSHTDTCRDGD